MMEINLADLQEGELITLAEACRILPRKPSPATLWRWRLKGVTVNGQCIRLACVRVGAKWFTTRQAMADFIRQQTEAATPLPAEDKPQERSPEMVRRLREAGLL